MAVAVDKNDLNRVHDRIDDIFRLQQEQGRISDTRHIILIERLTSLEGTVAAHKSPCPPVRELILKVEMMEAFRAKEDNGERRRADDQKRTRWAWAQTVLKVAALLSPAAILAALYAAWDTIVKKGGQP